MTFQTANRAPVQAVSVTHMRQPVSAAERVGVSQSDERKLGSARIAQPTQEVAESSTVRVKSAFNAPGESHICIIIYDRLYFIKRWVFYVEHSVNGSKLT